MRNALNAEQANLEREQEVSYVKYRRKHKLVNKVDCVECKNEKNIW